MTNATQITADPLITTPRLSPRWRFRVLLLLFGSYYFVAFAAPIFTDEAGLLLLKPHGWWQGVDQHWLFGCAILIAGWMALGAGRMAMRTVQGLTAIGWLLLAWLLGLTMSPNWKFELEFTTLACLAVAVVAFVILIVLRGCSGRTLVQIERPSELGTRQFQYSLATLLLVTLLICLTFAFFGWIDPRYRNNAALVRAQSIWYFGLQRQELEWDVLKVTLGLTFIMAAGLPVFLSQRKRRFVWALGLSAVALVVTVLINPLARSRVLVPLLQGNPIERHLIDYYFVHHITNFATVVVCLVTAASAMHWLGYRLAVVRPETAPPGE